MSDPVEFDLDPTSCGGWWYADDVFPPRFVSTVRRPSEAYCRRVAENIVKKFGLKPGDEVLEVGCSDGFILLELLRLGMRVTGVEANEQAVEALRPEIRHHVHHWRGQSLPFSAKEFDFVLCNEALSRMDNPALMIEQIGRVGKQALLVIRVADCLWQEKLMSFLDGRQKWCEKQGFWTNILDGKNYDGAVSFKRLF